MVERYFFRFALAFFGRGVPTHRIKDWCKRVCCAIVSRLIGHSLTLQFKLNSRVYIQSVSRYRRSSDVVWRNLVTHDRLTWPRCLSSVARLNACSQHRNRTELQSDVQSPQHIDAVVAYLRRPIQDRQHSHNLRSTTTTLCQPSTTTTFAKRAYRCSAPAVWNSLPQTVVNSDSVTVFKSTLKTFLFSRSFSLPASQQHTAWPQRLWSYNLMALYKSVYCYY